MNIDLSYTLVGAAPLQGPTGTHAGPFRCQLDGATLTTTVPAPDIETARRRVERHLFAAPVDTAMSEWTAAARNLHPVVGSVVVDARLPGNHRDTYVYGATPDGRWSYRWQFTRRFEAPGSDHHGTACWIMLNPSASDVVSGGSRRTLQRVITETRAFGHRDITIINLFSARAASAAALRKVRSAGVDIVGNRTDDTLAVAVAAADRVVVAWGSGGKLAGRGRAVAQQLAASGKPAYCLGHAGSGQPFHPTAERSGHATLSRQPFQPHLVR